ncbi:aspartate-semialdehyde dehydrogenase, partial [Klebsiella pneumoniae]
MFWPGSRDNSSRLVKGGLKLFVCGDCSITVSMMVLAGLINADLMEWLIVMTYQSASGAGAKQVRQLLAENAYISQHLSADELTLSGSVLQLVNKVRELIN